MIDHLRNERIAIAHRVIDERWGDTMDVLQVNSLAGGVVDALETIKEKSAVLLLRRLVAACTRYDDDPDNMLNQAAYEQALALARSAVSE